MRTFNLAIFLAVFSVAVAPAAESASISDAKVVRDDTTIMITWDAIGGVDVLSATDPNADVADMELLTRADGDGIFAVTDVDPATRYYFYLRHRDGSGVHVAARLLPLEGGRNFRDLGGYTTTDGKTVKWGHIFRSGMMADLTADDYRYLSSIGIKVVCDLRANEERADEPTDWAAPGAEYVSWDYPAEANSSELMQALQDPEITPEKMAMGMAATYYDILEDQKPRYREMFDRLAKGEIPLAFNCSAGKDRAGTGAALILSALGVEREQIVKDYSLSELFVDYAAEYTEDKDNADNPYAFLAQLPPELLMPLMRSDPAYIRGTFAYLDEKYGGVENFIRTELDVDGTELAAIRAKLLY